MTTKEPRQTKTPRVRALEAVAVLERRLAKIREAKATLERQARDLNPQIDAVVKRLEYARANPDLPRPGAKPGDLIEKDP